MLIAWYLAHLDVVHSGNPPNTVAKLFMEYLAHFSFKKVVFAIIDNTLIGRTTSNYKIFKSVLSGQMASSLNPA